MELEEEKPKEGEEKPESVEPGQPLAKRGRSKRTEIQPGVSLEGQPLPSDDHSIWTKNQKVVWDKIAPQLSGDILESWHDAVQKKNKDEQKRIVNSLVPKNVKQAMTMSPASLNVACVKAAQKTKKNSRTKEAAGVTYTEAVGIAGTKENLEEGLNVRKDVFIDEDGFYVFCRKSRKTDETRAVKEGIEVDSEVTNEGATKMIQDMFGEDAGQWFLGDDLSFSSSSAQRMVPAVAVDGMSNAAVEKCNQALNVCNTSRSKAKAVIKQYRDALSDGQVCTDGSRTVRGEGVEEEGTYIVWP